MSWLIGCCPGRTTAANLSSSSPFSSSNRALYVGWLSISFAILSAFASASLKIEKRKRNEHERKHTTRNVLVIGRICRVQLHGVTGQRIIESALHSVNLFVLPEHIVGVPTVGARLQFQGSFVSIDPC